MTSFYKLSITILLSAAVWPQF